jgi:hypothetical protein
MFAIETLRVSAEKYRLVSALKSTADRGSG